MATPAENGLFPPLVEPYMPAQNIKDIVDDMNGGLKISFSSSQFNTLSDIHAVHISVVNQLSYQSLLRSETCPMGIYITDDGVPTDYGIKDVFIRYTNYINAEQLAYNTYYKIQIRFCKIGWQDYEQLPDIQDHTAIGYLTHPSVIDACSEWSTVALVRVVANNKLQLMQNNVPFVDEVAPGTADDQIPFGTRNDITSSNVTLTGKYFKEQITKTINNNVDAVNNDAEYMSTYKIKLYDVVWSSDTADTLITKNNLIYESPNISVNLRNSYNEMNYVIPYSFECHEGSTREDRIKNYYLLEVSYETANLYNNTQRYVVCVNYHIQKWSNQHTVDEIIGLDSVIGKVGISFSPMPATEIVPDPVIPANTILYIRRSDKTSNFTIWEQLWEKTILEDTADVINFDDYTIESGEMYQYEISCKLPDDDSVYSIKEHYVLSVFDNAFLTGEGTQLCVKFNTNISSFKRNVGDNIVTTIGSQYPFITRNGNMNYRSFSLSGMIAYEMDLEHTFTSRSRIYGDWIDVYGTYFVNRFINQQNDRITQREFREKVMDYFYDDKPKLFRSTPEGNILVRITDVSLTPNQQLSRMIYDFTCTVTEIGEANVENYKLYNIQDFGDLTL